MTVVIQTRMAISHFSYYLVMLGVWGGVDAYRLVSGVTNIVSNIVSLPEAVKLDI